MKALLWKDYRLNRAWMISGLVIWLVVYLIGVIIELAAHWPEMPTSRDWGGMLNSYGVVSLFMTWVAAAMFSGNAVAVERAERSAHFLAYLPPSRWEILTSKFIVAASIVVFMWGWALLSVYVLAPGMDTMAEADGPQVRELVGICVLTFGVGWMCSAQMEKTVGPIVVALASPPVVALVLETLVSLMDWPRSRTLGFAVNMCLGLLTLGVGTLHYLKRVEP